MSEPDRNSTATCGSGTPVQKAISGNRPYLFKPGNKAAEGHQNAAKALGYKRLTRENCPAEKWEAIVRKAVEQAVEGDAKARQWLSDIIIGKPKVKVEARVNRLTPEETQRRVRAMFGLPEVFAGEALPASRDGGGQDGGGDDASMGN